jgi:hypothetical protein
MVQMADAPAAQTYATVTGTNTFTMGWTSGGAGTHTLMWTTFGN